jgi:hypothetical protein
MRAGKSLSVSPINIRGSDASFKIETRVRNTLGGLRSYC